MKDRPPIRLGFAYGDEPEARILDLSDEVPCVPVLEKIDYRSVKNIVEFHRHEECIEFLFCRRGELVFETEAGTSRIYPGMVMVAQPSMRHRLLSTQRGVRFYGLFFRIPKGDYPLLRLDAAEAKWLRRELQGLPSSLISHGNEVRSLFRRLFYLYDHLEKGRPERTFRLRNAVTDLLLAFLDCERGNVRGDEIDPLRDVVAEMSAHPDRDYPLWEIAERLKISLETLRQRFRRLTGVPPHVFLVTQRIERAKKLLGGTGRSVAAIAGELGFSSPQNFATQFRLETGVTPSAWRMKGES